MLRLASCLDAVVVVVVVVLALNTGKVTGTIIFPDVEPCTLRTGEEGRCLPLPQCPPVLQTFKHERPVSCGFEGSTQIVCCPKGKDTTTKSPPIQIVDISPPSGYDALDCGKTAIKTIHTFGPFALAEEVIKPADGPFVGRERRANIAPLSSIRPIGPIARPKPIGPIEIPRPIGPEVVGGIPSPRNAWPWMALIGRRDAVGIDWFCGGALINDQWVLSALHCFHDHDAEVVRLGEHDHSTEADRADYDDFGVSRLVQYPDYQFLQGYHDLALLKLDRKVKLHRFILPVCLPWGTKSDENIVNNKATIVGWGNTLYGGFPSSVLMEAQVQVFPSSRCDKSYSSLPHYPDTWPQGIGKETLCAGDPQGGKDTCQGDSGGPMVIQGSDGRYVAAGVVSQGHGCGHENYPGLYVNLRHPPYLAWIKKVAFSP